MPVVSAVGTGLDGGVDVVTDEPGVGGVRGQLVVSGHSRFLVGVSTVGVQISQHDRLWKRASPEWSVLNEIGHGGSRDRKRGRVVN